MLYFMEKFKHPFVKPRCTEDDFHIVINSVCSKLNKVVYQLVNLNLGATVGIRLKVLRKQTTQQDNL